MYKLWLGQAQYMTILTFIWHLWPWPSTYLYKCFKWHFSSLRATTVKIILKSMHKCTSYAPDKLNICLWHFDLYLTPVTLTFNLPIKMVQMALLLLKGNNYAKLFWNPCIIVQVMVRTNPDGCTHKHRTKNVTTMSRLPASGLDNENDNVACLEMNPFALMSLTRGPNNQNISYLRNKNKDWPSPLPTPFCVAPKVPLPRI